MNSVLRSLQKYLGQWWYPPLLGLLAFADVFIIVIPMDGVFIAGIFANGNRRYQKAFWVSVGNTLGLLVLYLFIQKFGIGFVESHFAGFKQQVLWQWIESFFNSNGVIVLLVVALLPLAQQPGVILAALSKVAIYQVFLLVLLGRTIKYFAVAYIAHRTPGILRKSRSISSEIKEIE